VGNLSWSTQRDDLYSLFGKYGAVEDAFIPMDRETGRPRGFGFVTMESNSAKDAIDNLNETEFMVGLLGGLGFRGALFCPRPPRDHSSCMQPSAAPRRQQQRLQAAVRCRSRPLPQAARRVVACV
jgi:RNA recognition motif-containing protein